MANVKSYSRKSKTGKIHRVGSHYRKNPDRIPAGAKLRRDVRASEINKMLKKQATAHDKGYSWKKLKFQEIEKYLDGENVWEFQNPEINKGWNTKGSKQVRINKISQGKNKGKLYVEFWDNDSKNVVRSKNFSHLYEATQKAEHFRSNQHYYSRPYELQFRKVGYSRWLNSGKFYQTHEKAKPDMGLKEYEYRLVKRRLGE